MKQLKSRIWLQIFTIYLRYLIGGAFVFASIVKIRGERFTYLSGAEAPINSAWHFFETMYQSGLYWQFLGWGQLLAGLLLMTQRYSKLGALLFLPIIGNIFVITLSYDFNYTPVITGLMLLANFYLVAWHWDELKGLVNLPAEPETKTGVLAFYLWELTGLLLFGFTVWLRWLAVSYNIMFWLGTCLAIGLGAFVWGLGKYYGWFRRLGSATLERNS